MTTNNDGGHSSNVANFEDLISFTIGEGSAYNPTIDNIKSPQLETLRLNAGTTLQNVKNTKTIYDNACNGRETAFTPLKKLCTRVMNALEVSGVPQLTIDDARSINRKIQGGQHHTPDAANTAQPVQPANASAEPTPVHHSTSQQSFDYLVENFTKLIVALTAQPAYAPNETDLTVSALNTLLDSMKTLNTETITSYTLFSNARINRDTVLYAESTGLVDTALEVKKYIKSVFGATSPQYDQVSGLKFKKITA